MRRPIRLEPLIVAVLAAAVARPGAGAEPAHEVRVPVGSASLYAREIGRGQPIVVLHGGPDFDHTYLLPDMDRLADAYRLVYYDQRGRGRSGDGVRAEDFREFRKERLEKLGADLDRIKAAAATDGYKAGDPDAVAAPSSRLDTSKIG